MGDRDLKQRSLDALMFLMSNEDDDCGDPSCPECQFFRPVRIAIACLRESLKQPDPEPVLIATRYPNNEMGIGFLEGFYKLQFTEHALYVGPMPPNIYKLKLRSDDHVHD